MITKVLETITKSTRVLSKISLHIRSDVGRPDASIIMISKSVRFAKNSPMNNLDLVGIVEALFQLDTNQDQRPHCLCGCTLSNSELEQKGYIRYGDQWWHNNEIHPVQQRRLIIEEKARLIAMAPRHSSGESLPSFTDTELHVKQLSISCDGCGSEPILGPRFHCSECDNYDLCLNCVQKIPHAHSFAIFKESVW